MSATVDIDASLGRINARSRPCAQSTVGTLEKRRDVTPTGLLHGRSLWLLQKWRDVEEPPGVVLVQAEEMSAIRTPVAPEQVRTFAHQMEDPVLPARWAILDVHDGQVLGLLRGRGLETPQRPAKDPAPMHVGIHRLPHGACQPSLKRFAPSLGRRGRMCGRSRVKRSLSSASGINTARRELGVRRSKSINRSEDRHARGRGRKSLAPSPVADARASLSQCVSR